MARSALGTLAVTVAALVMGVSTVLVAPSAAPASELARVRGPDWAPLVPKWTDQVVRTVSSREYCRRVWCTVTQAWERNDDGHWEKRREFRSTIGSSGWGKQREGDRRSPDGLYRIKTTFTTTASNPGDMPWRRRRPTSVVTSAAGPNYNTWLEIHGVTSGDRPSMRSGWVLDFNNVRLRPGVGPAPVQGRGSGIFYHTSKPGHLWAPTAGCTQVGNARQMRWLLTWLRPDAKPRVVQNR